MKKNGIGFFVLTAMLLAAFSNNSYCNSHWDEFLQQPGQDTLEVLKESIVKSKDRCVSDIAPEQKHRTQLFEHIRNGDKLAFKAAMMVYKCWDGGELGDFYRSAGMFFEIHPYFFFLTLQESLIPDSELESFLTMLPLSTTDKLDLKLSIIDNRIAILESINEESFEEMKISGLFYLNKFKRFIIRTKKELEETK
jgi:hypothetical protein